MCAASHGVTSELAKFIDSCSQMHMLVVRMGHPLVPHLHMQTEYSLYNYVGLYFLNQFVQTKFARKHHFVRLGNC